MYIVLWEMLVLSMCRCGTIEVVLQYAKWALDRNQEVAVRVFTERIEGEKSEQLEPHFLLDFLKPYPDATLVYLEYLVNDRNSMVYTRYMSAYTRIYMYAAYKPGNLVTPCRRKCSIPSWPAAI